MTVKVEPKFWPCQRCEVQMIKVLIGKTGNQSFIYNVQLDRRTARVSKAYPNGKLMFLNVSSSEIREISN